MGGDDSVPIRFWRRFCGHGCMNIRCQVDAGIWTGATPVMGRGRLRLGRPPCGAGLGDGAWGAISQSWAAAGWARPRLSDVADLPRDIDIYGAAVCPAGRGCHRAGRVCVSGRAAGRAIGAGCLTWCVCRANALPRFGRTAGGLQGLKARALQIVEDYARMAARLSWGDLAPEFMPERVLNGQGALLVSQFPDGGWLG